jgi:hypothetical protein
MKTHKQAQAPRHSTVKMLEIVRKAAADEFGKYVSDTDIWRSLASKDFLLRTAQFLWKGYIMHTG